jgi:hypothetical protein
MLSALVILVVGPDYSLTKALTDAAWRCQAAAEEAKRELDAIPALLWRRVLCTLVCPMRQHPRERNQHGRLLTYCVDAWLRGRRDAKGHRRASRSR